MLSTYKATLRGNHLEWTDTPPDTAATDQPVAVHVTILDETVSSGDTTASGARMAAILEQLAQQLAFHDVANPAAWERSVRVDRDLPERNS